MKRVVLTIVKIIGVLVLAAALVDAVWQPVLPSRWIIQKMADSIDPRSLSAAQPATVRFELSGKGGGTYSVVVDKGSVTLVAGPTERADLILYMEAKEFNDLIFALSKGKADEYTFRSLIVAKVITFAGDMAVFKNLFSKKGGNP